MKLINPIQLSHGQALDSRPDKLRELENLENAKDIQLKEKAEELEAVFMTQMIKAMEKTIPEGLMGGKHSLPSMMFSGVMADAVSNGGGMGLAKMIYTSLRDDPNAWSADELNTEAFMQAMEAGQFAIQRGADE